MLAEHEKTGFQEANNATNEWIEKNYFNFFSLYVDAI